MFPDSFFPEDYMMYEKHYPGFYRALKKYGEKKVVEYLTNLWEWAVEGKWPYADLENTNIEAENIAKYLVENINILKTIQPPPKPPAVLYRGITIFERAGMPDRHHRVIYTTKRPATAWTEEKIRVKDYCTPGVQLECSFGTLNRNAKLFLYPFEKGSLLDKWDFGRTGNQEWGFWIVKNFRVDRWKFCDRY